MAKGADEQAQQAKAASAEDAALEGGVALESNEQSEADARRLDAAARILSRYSAWSVAAGAVPVPIVDVAALAVLQTKMIADLAELYEKPVSLESVRTVISVLLGILVPMSASDVVGRVAGFSIPGVGPLVNIVSMAAFSGAATYAVGRVFVRHFEGGGSLFDFSVDAIRKDLQHEFTRARKSKAAAAASPAA